MAERALDLFQAYNEGKLPREGGYIVSSFFSENSAYSIYEVVAYSGVKNLYLSSDGLTFQTDGNKLFVLVEPASYPKKFVEPVSRSTTERIPHRFSELETYTTKNQTKVYVSKEPIITYSSFTILKPSGINFSIVFYPHEDIMKTIEYFFSQTFNREAKIASVDAKKASKLVTEGINKFSIW
jgi:hypothetical protein